MKVAGKSGAFYKLDFTTRRWDANKKQYIWDKHDAFISAKTRFRDEPLPKVRFVDVGQGDGAIVESPRGQIVLIGGGENWLGCHLIAFLSLHKQLRHGRLACPSFLKA